MRKALITLSIAVFALFTFQLLIAASAFAAKKQVIIGYYSDPDERDEDNIRADGGNIKLRYQIIPAIAADVEEAKLGKIRKDPKVKYVEPDYVISIDQNFPNDLDTYLWGLHNTGQIGGPPDADIDAPEAWDIQTGSSNVVIAVIDTGVDYNHPDLASNMWVNAGEIPGNGIDDDGNGYVDDVHGYNFFTLYGDPMDDHKHGTHCAGTIAAVGNNGIGVVGVNWTANIMALKILNEYGSGSTSLAVKALEYTIKMKQRGVPIIATSNSWGGGSTTSLRDAIDAVNQNGILFIAAAGNRASDNDIEPFYPASYDLENIISVAATDVFDMLANFSNYGATSVDLAAPGVSILSTIPGNSYDYLSGTSMATPHVSGVAALVKAQFPSMTHLEIKDRILNSVDPKSSLSGKILTGGRLNARNALDDGGGGDTTPPAKVSGLTVNTVSSSQLNLSWNANTEPDLDHYKVYRSNTSSGPYSQIGLSATNSYSDAGLTPSTTYYYVVAAFDSSGNKGQDSDEASGMTAGNDTTPPAKVSGLTVNTVSSSQLNLSWTANTEPDLSHYRVYRSNIPGGPYSQIGLSITNSYSDAGLTPSTTYYYVVAAFDSSGNKGQDSDEASGKTKDYAVNYMYVQSISFSSKVAGKNIFLYTDVRVVGGEATETPLSNAMVQMTLTLNNGERTWSFSGTTDYSGIVRFTLKTGPGSYLAEVKMVTLTGYVFDNTRGEASDTCILNSNGSINQNATLAGFQLLQNNPNPFNPETWISYALASPENVIIRIFNATGRLVKTLDLGYREAGAYVSKERSAYWDGTNEGGDMVSSGLYFYTIEAGSFRAVKKMLLIR